METKTIQQFMNSYSVKMIVVTGLAIVLLIPSFLIQEIIHERIQQSEKVKNELYRQWGGKQVIAGPVLNIPYTVSVPGDYGQPLETRQGVAHFLPETLKTNGLLTPETRKRGIYKVAVYEGKLHLQGTFAQPDFSALDLTNAEVNWNAAYFTLGITDMRGIKNLPELVVNEQKYLAEPGVADNDLFQSGITIKAGSFPKDNRFDFDIDLILKGSEELSVEALGKTTDISLKSDWTNPSFTGGFLPEKREVNSAGFTADWKVTHLNRNFPQHWVNNRFKTNDARMGVELLIPVDHYLKSMRSAKYAILFIALNFIIFIFIEIRSKLRIHPFQYSLVAFALLIFYALLTSIGEQTGFNLAYLISALAVTGLISWYAYTILKELRLVIWITLLQTGLYLFLFTILQLQDYALLTGSIGLFVILIIVMQASRQIKWYSGELT